MNDSATCLMFDDLVFNCWHLLFQGYAKGVVINTGDRSVIGRIANLTSTMDSGDTPIARELSNLVKIIVVIAFAMGAIFIIVIIVEGYDPVNAVIFLVGIIMGNVPEGLLATVTVSKLPFLLYAALSWPNVSMVKCNVMCKISVKFKYYSNFRQF